MDERRTVLITGASSGIGEEMARQFADKGYDLALCARREERLRALRVGILASHPDCRVEIRRLDVTDDEEVFAVFRGFWDDFTTIDRVIVNAGVGQGAKIGTGRADVNRQTVMTNVIGALNQTEAAMEIFRAQQSGHLVMISSMAAVRGLPGATATYAATKTAVAHLVEGLRVEFDGTALRFTVIYPGYIISGMNEPSSQAQSPLMSGTVRGARSIVAAIEAEKGRGLRAPAALAPAEQGDAARPDVGVQAAALRSAVADYRAAATSPVVSPRRSASSPSRLACWATYDPGAA